MVPADEAAKAQEALFLDLNAIMADHYDKLGQEHVSATFFGTKDRTHTIAAGAQFTARCVVEGLRVMDKCPLVDYLRKNPGKREPAQ